MVFFSSQPQHASEVNNISNNNTSFNATCGGAADKGDVAVGESSLRDDQQQQQQLPLTDDDYRKPFLQLFILINSLGSSGLGLVQLSIEGFSCSALASVLLGFITAALLYISMPSLSKPKPSSHQKGGIDLYVGLYAYCCILDVVLVVVVFTDGQERDVFMWFLAIPFLFLHARGVKSCVIALVVICVQTTILRCLRQHYQWSAMSTPNAFRHTIIACHYHARVKVTEQLRSALREKEAINAELRRATQAKSDFLANMSHELRTPMHGIIAMCRELQDSMTSGSTSPNSNNNNEAIDIISTCAEHLLSLVSDILDFERIESNQLQLEAIPFSIVNEARKAVHLLQITADKKQIHLTMHHEVAHPLHRGDPLRFRQILFNLLSNAIKFTPTNGSVTVAIHNDSSSPQEVIASVTDTGIGIKQENLKLLFAPFSQLDSSICRKFGGSGLGLAISRQLSQAMGGSIKCESEPGHGSTFTCRLLLPVVSSEDQPLETVGLPEEDEPARLGLNVLLVEDNLINQKVGLRMLNSLGCETTVVNNGQECLDLLAEHKGDPFDVVLMDCQMPVMDGFEATQQIRKKEQEKNGGDTDTNKDEGEMVIVALTASATKEYAKRCREAGMSDVLFKPLRREDLACTLRKWHHGLESAKHCGVPANDENGPLPPPEAQDVLPKVMCADL